MKGEYSETMEKIKQGAMAITKAGVQKVFVRRLSYVGDQDQWIVIKSCA